MDHGVRAGAILSAYRPRRSPTCARGSDGVEAPAVSRVASPSSNPPSTTLTCPAPAEGQSPNFHAKTERLRREYRLPSVCTPPVSPKDQVSFYHCKPKNEAFPSWPGACGDREFGGRFEQGGAHEESTRPCRDFRVFPCGVEPRPGCLR
jgi:hypothetical protein